MAGASSSAALTMSCSHARGCTAGSIVCSLPWRMKHCSMRQNQFDAAGAEHICIVLLTGLGDVVHGLPIASALKRALPARRITWVAEPMPAALLANHPCVDNVVVFRKKDGWSGLRRLQKDLAGKHFDATLNFNIYIKSVFPTLLSRAPVRIGFGRDRAREGVWLSANHRLPARARRHTQDMFLEFAGLLGVAAEPLDWKLELTDAERAAQSR